MTSSKSQRFEVTHVRSLKPPHSPNLCHLCLFKNRRRNSSKHYFPYYHTPTPTSLFTLVPSETHPLYCYKYSTTYFGHLSFLLLRPLFSLDDIVTGPQSLSFTLDHVLTSPTGTDPRAWQVSIVNLSSSMYVWLRSSDHPHHHVQRKINEDKRVTLSSIPVVYSHLHLFIQIPLSPSIFTLVLKFTLVGFIKTERGRCKSTFPRPCLIRLLT